MPIQILLVDDHEIVRIGLKHVLSKSDIVVSAEAGNMATGFPVYRTAKFDVVLVDVRFPDGDGLQLLSKIKLEKPTQNSLVMSAYDNPTCLAKAVAYGANGFLVKSDPISRIVDSIKRAAAGENLWTKEEMRRISAGLSGIQKSESEILLTIRENEVLQQLSNGLTNKEIALALGISYETVKEHVQHLLRKIGVSDRTQAAVWAVRRNLV
ncbi:MAG: response regulator [Pirellula sp.]|jgi:DNA-binding NarL/FixJ family response regulator|nr:response regulator transcription factor [Pirellula sp.]